MVEYSSPRYRYPWNEMPFSSSFSRIFKPWLMLILQKHWWTGKAAKETLSILVCRQAKPPKQIVYAITESFED
jgi:hypothetical protein